MDAVMISWMICAIVVGYKVGQNPRYKCMISQARWISQKEWDEA